MESKTVPNMHFPELFSNNGKKKKKSKSAFQPLKNPCLALNELRPGLEYKLLEQTGPVHMPTFKIAIDLDGQIFTGEGRSKKQAKHAAALQCLQSGFIQIKDTNLSQQAMQVQMMENNIDFTSDDPMDQKGLNFELDPNPILLKKAGEKRKLEEIQDFNSKEKEKPVTKKMKISASDKNPVMLLNELKPGLKYEVEECGDSPATKRFVMTVSIENHSFEGSGASKKLAKQACARMALTTLYNFSFTPGLTMETDSEGQEDQKDQKVPGTTISVSDFSLPQHTADKIGKLVMDKFTEMIVGQASSHSRRKVLAGIVLSKDGDVMDDMEVISVTTGTKCINGEHMSVNGNSLNDCHAEIVSRRCLLSFFYSQLEKFANSENENENIFEPLETGGYKLRPEYRFHLYINTAPCGDARIFSPHEAETEVGNSANPATAASDPHPNRKARGQLRTKIESGEGTIPVKSSDGIQTWDGVLQGSRLLTMSCSDKLSRWNVLGVQGALLAHYVQPIYFHSVTLGSLFHPSHMFRAMGGRIQGILENLPELYSLNVPRLNLLSSPEVRQPGKAPNYSVNWAKGFTAPEVVDAMKGKEQDKGIASRLAKVSLFKRFLKIANCPVVKPLSSNSSSLIDSASDVDWSQYSEAKLASKAFQEAKTQLFAAFKKSELGTWVKKPMEQDEFNVTVASD